MFRIGANFFCLLFGVLIFLGVGEIIVRAFHLAPEVAPLEIDFVYGGFVSVADPDLIYVPNAGKGDINSYGLRDYEYPLEKPPRTFRIVVLGDSVAFGYCRRRLSPIPLSQIFPKVLEARLATHEFENIDRVEVLSLIHI